METVTAEQLKMLDNKAKCRVMKEIINGNVRYNTMNRPPLGLMPKKMWDLQRKRDIEDAAKRYNEAGQVVPTEWVKEHMVLSWLYDRKQSALEGQEWD